MERVEVLEGQGVTAGAVDAAGNIFLGTPRGYEFPETAKSYMKRV